MGIDQGGNKYGSYTKNRDVYRWNSGSNRETAVFVDEIIVELIAIDFAVISCNPSWGEQQLRKGSSV